MIFPLADFRLGFPEFSDTGDAAVLATADLATGLADFGRCKKSKQIWQFLTAHLLASKGSSSAVAGGRSTASGVVASATIDKVSVSYAVPGATDAWSMALQSTDYGRLSLALLAACRKPSYIGGLPEGAGFTKVGGRRWR